MGRDMFRRDQADRTPEAGGIDWEDVGPRDDARRARVCEMLDNSEVQAPLDLYHAAFMCHHAAGGETWFYRAANFLSLEAVRLRPDNKQYRWLFAAAKDRLLRDLGKPQLFGIQTVTRRKDKEWWI